MNNKMVEMTLKRIMEIDNNGIKMRNKIDETAHVREKELKKLFRKMEFDVMRAARKEAKKEYNTILENVKTTLARRASSL